MSGLPVELPSSTHTGVAVLSEHTVSACTGHNVTLSCTIPQTRLHITQELYGQSDTCSYDARRCVHVQQTPHRCNTLRVCVLHVAQHYLARCGLTDYVQVKYSCVLGVEGRMAATDDTGLSQVSDELSRQQGQTTVQPVYDVTLNTTWTNTTVPSVVNMTQQTDMMNDDSNMSCTNIWWGYILGGLLCSTAALLVLAAVLALLYQRRKRRLNRTTTPEHHDNVGFIPDYNTQPTRTIDPIYENTMVRHELHHPALYAMPCKNNMKTTNGRAEVCNALNQIFATSQHTQQAIYDEPSSIAEDIVYSTVAAAAATTDEARPVPLPRKPAIKPKPKFWRSANGVNHCDTMRVIDNELYEQ